MSALSNFVSIHPYFKVHPGKLETVKAGFPRFVEKTFSEKKNFFYEFTVNGDEMFCREGYTDADGVLAHLDKCRRAARGIGHDGRSHPVRSARPGDGTGKVESSSRPSQSRVVRDRK
jgi:quinol monooxygenase YgiN